MSGERLLLVEDDDLVRKSLSTVLTDAGFRVDAAPSGSDGVRRLQDQAYDAAIIDLRLGDMDGVTFLRQLRALQPDVAPVMVTGYGSVESAKAALKEGAVDYLLKPIAPESLLSVLRKALGQRSRGSAGGRLLLLCTDSARRLRLRETLEKEGIPVDEAGTLREARELLHRGGHEAAVADLHLPDGSGLDLRGQTQAVLILMGEPKDVSSAVEAFRSGAYEFLPTLAEPGEVLRAVSEGLRWSRQREPKPGRCYLVEDKEGKQAVDLLRLALEDGHRGVIITRNAQRPPLPGTEVLKLGTGVPGRGLPTLAEVTLAVQAHFERNRKSGGVVLLEGLEYLRTLSGLDEMLRSCYALRDTAEATGGILVMSIDPEAWVPRELALLEREIQPLGRPDSRPVHLKDDERHLLDLLVSRKGAYQTDLVTTLGFPKAKVSRILDRLEALGLIERRRVGMSNLIVPRQP